MMDLQRLWPIYWLQNYKTDWEWDTILNKLLDEKEIIVVGNKYEPLTCFLGGIEVWTSNWPYAYGYCYEPNVKVLPSVATRKRLKEAMAIEMKKIQNSPMDAVRAALAAKNP